MENKWSFGDSSRRNLFGMVKTGDLVGKVGNNDLQTFQVPKMEESSPI